MDTSREQFTRRVLQQARLREQLVDLSEEASGVGLDCSCEMNEHLYRSLFWEYPSAGEQDIVAVGDLLKGLRFQLESSSQPGIRYYTVRPLQPTWWLQPSYTFKLMVTCCHERVESVVILSEKDTLESLVSCLPRSVPASLLVQLMQSIRRLGRLSFQSERPLVRSLDATVTELLRRSPLQEEISHYLDRQHHSLVPAQFTRVEYREVILRGLLGQLELTAAVAEKMGARIRLPVSGVLQLMANYVGFVPPTADVPQSGVKVRYH